MTSPTQCHVAVNFEHLGEPAEDVDSLAPEALYPTRNDLVVRRLRAATFTR